MWRWECESVSCGEWGRSDRMRCVVAAFVKGGSCFVGEMLCKRRLVRVIAFCCMECITEIVRVCGGVNEVVAIEWAS